jgi:uncharacterized protein (UPF0548 family)
MLLLRKPSVGDVRRFLAAQAGRDFSYTAVGATARELPARFVVDRTRVRLGRGEAVFESARAALGAWRQFELGWLEAWPANTPIRAGEVVALVARTAGLWWLNACRIVYAVDESGPTRRYGFAYGTLLGHVMRGEERFLVEWDGADESVWYSILAFSRPAHPMARIGYPLVRRTQKRFGRESTAAMLRAVGPGDEAVGVIG